MMCHSTLIGAHVSHSAKVGIDDLDVYTNNKYVPPNELNTTFNVTTLFLIEIAIPILIDCCNNTVLITCYNIHNSI